MFKGHLWIIALLLSMDDWRLLRFPIYIYQRWSKVMLIYVLFSAIGMLELSLILGDFITCLINVTNGL